MRKIVEYQLAPGEQPNFDQATARLQKIAGEGWRIVNVVVVDEKVRRLVYEGVAEKDDPK